MSRTRWLRTTTALLAVSVLAAACGGDDDEAATTTSATTSAAATSVAATTTAAETSAAATSAAAETSAAATTAAAETSAAAAAPAGDVKGTVSFSGLTNDKAAAEAVFKLFEAKYPEAKVQATFADVDGYQPAIRTQLTSGTAPDVFFVWPGDGNPAAVQVLQEADLIADLSDMPWAANMPKGLDSVTKIDGKTYIAVTGVSGIGAIYNEKVLTELGATAPTTWSEVLAFCKTAKAKGKPAYALGNGANWVTQLIPYALSATLVYQDNPNFAAEMQAGSKTFTGSNWEKVFTQYQQMEKEGCFQAKPLGTSYEVSTEMVGKGEAAALVNGNWALDPIKKAAPADAKFVMKPLPATDSADQTWMPLAASGSYGLNKKLKNEEASKAFINFLMSPEGMAAYMGVAGGLPAISDPNFKVDPALNVLDEYNASGKSAPFMDQLWPNAEVQQTHFVAVADMFGGKAQPADVTKRMDEAYKKG